MKSSSSKIITRSRWFILLLVLHVCVFSARSEDIIVSSGILNETMFNRGRPVLQESSSNEFRATISTDGRWALEVRPIHKKGDALYGKEDAIYMTFDGSDTYFCQYSEAIIGMTNGRPGLIGTQPVSSQPQWSYVSDGDYPFAPFDSQKRAHILWLVYGAGKYIHDSKPESIPLPWMPVRWSLLSYGFRLKYELSPDSPYITTSLQFIRDSKLDAQSEDSEYNRYQLDQVVGGTSTERRQNELIQRKTKWKDGAIAGLLKTESFTNLDGFYLPLSFKFETFIYSGKPGRLYVATVTNIISVKALPTEDVFHPPILAKLSVLDSRFRIHNVTQAVDNILYNLKNGDTWLPKDSSLLQKEFKVYLNTPQISARHNLAIVSSMNIKRLIIIGILFATTLIPLIILVKVIFLSNSRRKPKIN